MNIYVGNLSYECSESDLKDLFSEYGAVASAKIISDQATGRSRGFGFVEYESSESGNAAIDALNEKDFKGRKLVVNEARPKK